MSLPSNPLAPQPLVPRRPVTHQPAPTPAQLLAALERGDIRTAYQPKVSLATGELIGVEALARWTDTELGAVPPDRFIGVAERNGLIGRLTLSVLRKSLAACAQLRRSHPDATVAVNVSPLLLDDPALPDQIAALLHEAEMQPSALVVEITEGQPVGDVRQAAATLTSLRLRGVACALDDFGTGHANLQALLRLPFTELKIDRSFIARAAIMPEAWKIVRATLRLAHELSLRVVAEGIETIETETWLRDEGCDAGQGYRYGRPMPAEALLAQWTAASAGTHPRS